MPIEFGRPETGKRPKAEKKKPVKEGLRDKRVTMPPPQPGSNPSGWLHVCRDYRPHQFDHAQTGSGYSCRQCYPEDFEFEHQ